jgi:metallo-beta-lactamase class B
MAQCAGRDGWSDPSLPVRIHGDTYWVGTCGISAILIASPQGHILIDGATAEGAPVIAANIERLGFRMADVDLILASHEHFDHVGGLAELQPLRLTAHLTPGHAPGGTSWSWRSCEGARCVTIAYADSTSSISAEAYRFSNHPDYVATFRASLNKMAALPCDILITPHPSGSNLFERLAGKAPLIDSRACAAYAARGRSALDQRLAREAAR